MLYLFWDIDGTLILTGRAGIVALEDAAAEVLDRAIDLSTMRTAGMTDAEICLGITGGDVADAAAVLARYVELLPAALHTRDGAVLRNVRENLEALAGRDDVVSMLLTGNVAEGAEAKLRHYGLWDFFAETGGAFSIEGDDRPAIARRARDLAAEHGGEVPAGERMVVIGDTPHDVRCGQAIGARTLAVATGPSYDVADLEASGAWRTVAHLPSPAAFAELLGLPARV